MVINIYYKYILMTTQISKSDINKSKSYKTLRNAITMLNHSSVCELFMEVTTMKLVCYDIESSRMYYYNTSTTLYTEIGIKELAMKVTNTLREYLSSNMNAIDITELSSYGRLIKSVGNFDFIKNVANLLCGTCHDKEFIAKLDGCKSTVNFKNGLVDLKSLQFRIRTVDDFVSKCLEYDYSTDINDKLHLTIKKQILNICNDDERVRDDNMKWFGYCMTGETKQQKFLCTIGHSAQNGKSTLAKMFDNAFSIYSMKLDKSTFAKDNNKKHKQFALIKKPIRYVYIEEIDRNKLDGDVLKDFVDGDKINTEVMYGTSENIILHCKLNLLSNNNINFDTDAGIKRRGYSQEFTNRFIPAEDYKKLESTLGIYKKDESILDMIRTSEFKIAFCQIVLPYAQMYYKSGLTCSIQLTESFNDLCEDNDKMKEFVAQYYDITNNPKDKIHKDAFLGHYRYITNLKLVSWQNILNDIKRLGLNYVKNFSTGGQQGCLVGIKEKQNKIQNNNDHDFGVDVMPMDKFDVEEKKPTQLNVEQKLSPETSDIIPRKKIIFKTKKTHKVDVSMILDSFDD